LLFYETRLLYRLLTDNLVKWYCVELTSSPP
jgi:hypothetical protein